MKKKHNFIRIAWIGFFFLVAGVILLPNKAQLQNKPLRIQDLPQVYAHQKESHPKMESVLYRLMKVCLAEGMEKAKEFARERTIDMEGDLVRVVLESQSIWGSKKAGIAPSLVNHQVEALGGKVETSYRHMVQSIVPLYALGDLAALPSVRYLRLPLKAIPLDVTSQGVETTGADQWQDIAAYRSNEDVKVCILDAGFLGYEDLLGDDLPSSVTTRSFRADGDIHAHDHGTACAEIVHDMAPNAQLWLVNFDTGVEHHNAVDWIISEGVDIISYSMGWFNAGAGDGTGPICADVERASNNGIIWVSAAGNSAQDHWEGIFRDADSDKWHNFSGADEILDFWVPAESAVMVSLNWDDWGTWDGSDYSGSNQDYDLHLWIKVGGDWYFVDKSEDPQNGAEWPVEHVGTWTADFSAYWGVSIAKENATRNVKLEVFTYGNSLEIDYNVPAGSLLAPADSQHAVSVGATDWADDTYHSYSSRGPTADLRIKPDFCAPSGVSGVTYGSSNFYGTSASAPHVAGAFALLLGKTPFTLDQILNIFEDRAVDLGPSGKDNSFGHGRLNLVRTETSTR